MKQYYKNTIALWQRLVGMRCIVAKVANAVLYVIRDDNQAAPGTTSLGRLLGQKLYFMLLDMCSIIMIVVPFYW